MGQKIEQGSSTGRWILIFIFNVISSCTISIALFMVGFSIITKKFPPDFSQFLTTMDSLTQMAVVQSEVEKPKIRHQVGNEEAEVEELMEKVRKRQDLGSQFLSSDRMPASEPKRERQTAETNPRYAERIVESERRISSLQSRVEELALEIEALKRVPR